MGEHPRDEDIPLVISLHGWKIGLNVGFVFLIEGGGTVGAYNTASFAGEDSNSADISSVEWSFGGFSSPPYIGDFWLEFMRVVEVYGN